MLVPAREFNHLGNFCFRHLKSEHAADTHTMPVDMEHDLDGLFPPFVEESLENVNDELHGRVVVVEDKNLVEAGLLGFRPRLRNDAGSDVVARALSAIVARVSHMPKYQTVHDAPQSEY